MTARYDIIILGGGMAGTSLAAVLSTHARVLLVEAEHQLGSHSTGRSAALFFETYGNEVVRALTRASRSFLLDPPVGFTASPLLTPRGCLYVASQDEIAALHALQSAPSSDVLRRIPPEEAIALVPILRPDAVKAALLDPTGFDIDVSAVLHGYASAARRAGAEIVTSGGAASPQRDGDAWQVEFQSGKASAPVVVNATGAWADQVAIRAGVRPIGLTPMRRTAILVRPTAGCDISTWPFVINASETLYFKPDAGQLLISPANEDHEAPGDTAPDEIDVAIAVDRFEALTSMPVQRVAHRWSGQRTFSSDRTPVVGFAPDAPGFFWFAGQGGYGIQTAPAMAAAAAGLIVNGALPPEIREHGVRAHDLAPSRSSLACQ